jgi:PAS domain-containing protein
MTTRYRASFWIQAVLIAVCLAMLPLYLFDLQRQKHAEQQSREALAASDAGVWVWRLADDNLEWDSTMFRIYGRDQKTWSPSYGGFESCLHPEDKERVWNHVQDSIRTKTGYKATFRIITQTGHVRWIWAAGRVDSKGVYMTGICIPTSPENLTKYLGEMKP